MRALGALFASTLFLTTLGCGDAELEEVEDDPGFVDGKGDTGAATGPMRVTEVSAVAGAADEPVFIELENVSTQPVDLAGWYMSFSTRRLPLVAHRGSSSVVEPGGLALVVDADADLEAMGVPTYVPAVTISRDLGDLFSTVASRRLVLRDGARVVSDRADASKTTPVKGVSFERKPTGGMTLSKLGVTPGERNALAATDAASPVRALFANPPVDHEDHIAPELIAILDGAKTSIDGAFFQIESAEVIDAFIRAQQRGVTVRIVTDTRWFTHRDYAAGYQRMISAGVGVKEDKRTALMHNKFMVVDGKTVWTGSYNLLSVRHDHFEHSDNVVVFQSKEMAALHTAEFEEMWNGKFGVNKTATPAADREVWVNGARVEVWFSPTDKPQKRIAEVLSQAKDSVYFLSFSFYQPDLGAAMVERWNAGVDVRGVFDDTATAGVSSQFPILTGAGMDIRRPDVSLTLHNKFIVVDYGGADPIVITGSYNFSGKAEDVNDEALYIIHDRALAEAYYEVYRSLYDISSGPNTNTADVASLSFSEVASVSSGGDAFVELVNDGAETVPLAGLLLSDRDGDLVDLAELAGRGDLAPGARIALYPGASLHIAPSDPLALYDSLRRQVATFDAPAFPGSGKSLVRDDATALDYAATYSPATPTPGQ